MLGFVGILVEQPGTAPGSRRLQGVGAAFCLPLELVPRPSFDLGSPRLQRGAFTRLAYEARAFIRQPLLPPLPTRPRACVYADK